MTYLINDVKYMNHSSLSYLIKDENSLSKLAKDICALYPKAKEMLMMRNKDGVPMREEPNGIQGAKKVSFTACHLGKL